MVQCRGPFLGPARCHARSELPMCRATNGLDTTRRSRRRGKVGSTKRGKQALIESLGSQRKRVKLDRGSSQTLARKGKGDCFACNSVTCGLLMVRRGLL